MQSSYKLSRIYSLACKSESERLPHLSFDQTQVFPNCESRSFKRPSHPTFPIHSNNGWQRCKAICPQIQNPEQRFCSFTSFMCPSNTDLRTPSGNQVLLNIESKSRGWRDPVLGSPQPLAVPNGSLDGSLIPDRQAAIESGDRAVEEPDRPCRSRSW